MTTAPRVQMRGDNAFWSKLMRLFKFLNCKFGLKAIRERRLKISEVHSLNDPFDLIPFDLSDPELRRAIIAARSEIGQTRGLLCFSRQWHNPVLWAHYAESHKGFCLGFDLKDENHQQAVEYVEDPIRFLRADPTTANRMLFTKYSHWRYEDESRIWATLEERSGHYYFKAFDEQLRLREVILGAANPVSFRRVVQAVEPHTEGVRILKAQLAFDAFKVVEGEQYLAPS